MCAHITSVNREAVLACVSNLYEPCGSNGRMRMHTRCYPEKLKELYHLEDIGEDWRIILNWIVKRQCVTVYSILEIYLFLVNSTTL